MIRDPRTSNDATDRDYVPPDGRLSVDQLLDAVMFARAALDPARVRAVILAEHQKIRESLHRLETDAMALLACSVPNSAARQALVDHAFELCDQMDGHIAFENQVLVPVVEAADAWGPVRAQQIIEEHDEQLRRLRAYAQMLASDGESNQRVSVTVWQLVQSIGQDMREEEEQILGPEFLSEPCGEGVETG